MAQCSWDDQSDELDDEEEVGDLYTRSGGVVCTKGVISAACDVYTTTGRDNKEARWGNSHFERGEAVTWCTHLGDLEYTALCYNKSLSTLMA